MDYDRIIIEMLDRIKTLEDEVAIIKGPINTFDKKIDAAKTSKKYRRLTELLANSEGKPVSLSFKQVEDIIGFPLPDSAREHRAFWANTTSHSIALSWLSVGYKTVDVNLSSELVVFEK